MPGTVQSIGPFRLTVQRVVGAQSVEDMQLKVNQSLVSLEHDHNQILTQMLDALDNRMGYRGQLAIHNGVDMKGNPILDVGTQTASTSAATVGQIQGLQAFLDALQAQLNDLKRLIATLTDVSAVEGTFTITGTGFTLNPTGVARYIKLGKLVTLWIPQMSGTSNASMFTLAGLPSSLAPAQTGQTPALHCQDNSAHVWGFAELGIGSTTITMRVLQTIRDVSDDTAGIIPWTSTGTKQVYASMISYHLF